MSSLSHAFYPKLVHVTCAILLIPCACTQCKFTLDKPWDLGVTSHQQPCYQLVKYLTYCPVLGSFNNWNIIQLSHKATCSDDIEK